MTLLITNNITMIWYNVASSLHHHWAARNLRSLLVVRRPSTSLRSGNLPNCSMMARLLRWHNLSCNDISLFLLTNDKGAIHKEDHHQITKYPNSSRIYRHADRDTILEHSLLLGLWKFHIPLKNAGKSEEVRMCDHVNASRTPDVTALLLARQILLENGRRSNKVATNDLIYAHKYQIK